MAKYGIDTLTTVHDASVSVGGGGGAQSEVPIVRVTTDDVVGYVNLKSASNGNLQNTLLVVNKPGIWTCFFINAVNNPVNCLVYASTLESVYVGDGPKEYLVLYPWMKDIVPPNDASFEIVTPVINLRYSYMKVCAVMSQDIFEHFRSFYESAALEDGTPKYNVKDGTPWDTIDKIPGHEYPGTYMLGFFVQAQDAAGLFDRHDLSDDDGIKDLLQQIDYGQSQGPQ